MNEFDWSTGDGLLGVDDPTVVGDAFARNEKHVGIAVVGLALNHEDLDAIALHVVRAIDSADEETRRLSFLAAAHSARLFGRLHPAIAVELRRCHQDPATAIALDDVLSYVPFRELPAWLKGEYIRRTLRRRLQRR